MQIEVRLTLPTYFPKELKKTGELVFAVYLSQWMKAIPPVLAVIGVNI